MKITADTNVLVRAAVQDDAHQARKATNILQQAELVAVPVPVLCEFVWVLHRGYKKSLPDISEAIMKGSGWAQKSLFPSTRRLSLYCNRRAVASACCHNNWEPVKWRIALPRAGTTPAG
jgi:predicted nucleic acid-binding protein